MTTIFTETLGANDPGYTGYSARSICRITGGAGTQVRVTATGDTTATCTVSNWAIGISGTTDYADTTNNLVSTTATPVELVHASQAHGFTGGAGSTFVSSWANLTGFTSSNFLVVVFDFGGSNANPRVLTGQVNFATDAAATGCMTYKAASASYNASSALSYTQSSAGRFMVSLIEVQTPTAGGCIKRVYSMDGLGSVRGDPMSGI